jgi:uncharacterized membrane protein SirB2
VGETVIEFYAEIKLVHILSVVTSGLLFLIRGIAMGLGADWYMAAGLRYLSYTIDTILLTAALMLMTMLHQYPFVHGWLTVKVLFLVVYIVLGSFGLKRGATLRSRLSFWLAALLVYSFIISVAITKNPQGFLMYFPG